MLDFFTDTTWYEQAGAIVGMLILVANAITAAFPSVIGNKAYDIPMKVLNFLAMNVFHNKNADDTPSQ